MPSKAVYKRLVSAGLKIENRQWNRYNTLKTRNDLEQLFDVLCRAKDKNNKSAIMKPVTNMANPDFEKIKSGGFVEYHYEKFTDTLNRYYPDSGVFKLWKEGLDSDIFIPELHCREHIAVQL